MQSLDQILQDSTTVAVDRLIANADALQAEHDKHEAILDYLNRLKAWKDNAEQRAANRLPLTPLPVVPEGYVPTPAPAQVQLPPPDVTPLVGDETDPGVFMAIGDNNSIGTKISYKGMTLVKKGRHAGSFGISYWWEQVKE